jgi:hypothetical protein
LTWVDQWTYRRHGGKIIFTQNFVGKLHEKRLFGSGKVRPFKEAVMVYIEILTQDSFQNTEGNQVKSQGSL